MDETLLIWVRRVHFSMRWRVRRPTDTVHNTIQPQPLASCLPIAHSLYSKPSAFSQFSSKTLCSHKYLLVDDIYRTAWAGIGIVNRVRAGRVWMTERCSIARATVRMVYHDFLCCSFFLSFFFFVLLLLFLQHHALRVISRRDSQRKTAPADLFHVHCLFLFVLLLR